MSSLHIYTLYITFIIAIFLITSPPDEVSSLGIGSTISVSYGSNTICGILAGESQSISCYVQGLIMPVSPPNVSYDSVCGGNDFFCGLTSSGFSLHCWDTSLNNGSFQTKTIYDNATAPLTSLSVGEFHICALHRASSLVQCWQKKRNVTTGSAPFTLPKQSTQFISTTSGGGFSCGIVKESRAVLCWGENVTSGFIQNEFGDLSMLSLVAGKSHVCGLTVSGVLVCKGSNTTGQLSVPPNKGFEFSSVALGENRTCAVHSANGSVVCWGGNDLERSSEFMSFIVASFSLQSISAGLDFTCGLGTDLTMICWGPGWPTSLSFSMSEIPLPKVIPGPCVTDSCGICGIYPNSTDLCGIEGTNICKSCEIPLPPSSKPDGDVASAPPDPSPVPKSLKTSDLAESSANEASRHKLYLPLVITGSALILVILISSFLIFQRNVSDKQKKPVIELESTSSDVALNNTRDSALAGSYPSSALQSRSSSVNYTTSSTSSLAFVAASTRSMSLRPGNKAEKFSFKILAAATESFSSDNILGSGSFGTVYRGRLGDGRPVAIKREETMKPVAEDDETDLDSDLEVLSRLHHKHLVGLIGFCKEKQERLLIYEYMANGALHDHLHTEKGDTTLNSWRTRVKIALDAARGIEYLHNYAVPTIIHEDIKSSNVLIDSNWIARVSDFGLSTFSTDSSRGTVGYIDPEYNVTKVLTTKSDVYGFGVVLLELLTGKKAVFMNNEGMEPVSLAEYTGSYIQSGEVWKVLDKRIGYPLLHEAEAVELVASTALRCVSLKGKERPTISEVVANLEKAFVLCKENSGTEDISRNASFANFNN